MPGSQFPVEGYDNFVKQIVPRWTTTDDRSSPPLALVDKSARASVEPGEARFGFGWRRQRPDKIKAIVAVEPAVAGDKAKASA